MEQTKYQYDVRIVGRTKNAKPFDGNDLHLPLMPFSSDPFAARSYNFNLTIRPVKPLVRTSRGNKCMETINHNFLGVSFPLSIDA